MLFGLLSLMMGHWIIFVSKICINSSAMSSRFYPCVESGISERKTVELLDVPSSNHLNYSVPRQLEVRAPIDFCPEVVVTSYPQFNLYLLTFLHKFVCLCGLELITCTLTSHSFRIQLLYRCLDKKPTANFLKEKILSLHLHKCVCVCVFVWGFMLN